MKLSSPLGECRLAGASPQAASVGLPGLAGFLLCPKPLINIWWVRSAQCLVIFCSLLYLRRACRVTAGSCSGESHQRITRGTSCCRAEGRSCSSGRFETRLLAPHHTHGGERTPCCRGRALVAPSSPQLLPPKRPPKPHVLHGCTKPKALLVETRRAPSQLRFCPVCRGIAAIFAAAAAGEHHAQHAEKHLSAEPTWTQRIFYLHRAKNPRRGLNVPTWPKTKVLDPDTIPLVPTDGAQPFRVCHRSVRTQGTGCAVGTSAVPHPWHTSAPVWWHLKGVCPHHLQA